MKFELLHKFFDGLTTKEEEEAIREWLNNSPENKQIFLDERKIYDSILLNSSVVEENENQDVKPHFHITPYFKEFVKIAAIMLVTLLGSWYFFTQDKDASTAMQTISVPAGQRLNLTLPDGTNVWLNAKTTIQYPVLFNSKERLVTIDGQAYFDVAKNEKVPFIVQSPRGTVQALGTKFDVLDYSNSDTFETMLMEGSVKVSLLKDKNQSILLTPDHKAYLDNGELNALYVNDLSSYLWKDGLISFRNESFAEIMTSFEKVYDITIVVENPKVKEIALTGKFRVIDGVEYALRVLQREVNFKFERDTDSHIIYIR